MGAMSCLNKNSWTANNQFRYSQPRTTGFSSLSDRPWKEKEGWNANGRLLFNSPDPIVPILGMSSAKVTEWVSRQSLDYVMYFICWVTLRAGILPEVFRIYDSCWSIYSGGGFRAEQTPHSLDREDHQDFVIRCRTYSNSKSSDRIPFPWHPKRRKSTLSSQMASLSLSSSGYSTTSSSCKHPWFEESNPIPTKPDPVLASATEEGKLIPLGRETLVPKLLLSLRSVL